MTYAQANRWSWGITVLCACYIAWVCYVIKTRIPALAQLYAGLGGELPRATRFTIELSNGPVYIYGAILILGLALKESLLKNVIVRFFEHDHRLHDCGLALRLRD